MARKTQAIGDLVNEVLSAQPTPYGEDIIDEVFAAIERNPQWMLRYRALSNEREHGDVNQWVGWYAKEITGKQSEQEVPTRLTTLAKTYTRLR